MWSQQDLTVWTAALQAGEVVAAPAEGVYGYCVDPFNVTALQQLMTLKQRDPSKGVICLVRNLADVALLCGDVPEETYDAIRTYWPSVPAQPVTLILPAKLGLPELLTGGRGSLALRWTACDYMQKYLSAWGGPLVSTSLNISGDLPATDAAAIPLTVPALTCPEPLPGYVSKVYDPMQGVWLR